MAFGMLAFNGHNQDDDKVNLKDVKCVVMSKRAAKDSQVVKTKKGAMLFMCCGNCVKAYEKNPEKFTVAANHQLVQTKQYVQKACPFSGGELNDDAKVKVGGVELKMCCGNCAKKVNSAESEEAKAKLVFSKKAFEKGFAMKKAEKK